jgi:hypothetical protein
MIWRTCSFLSGHTSPSSQKWRRLFASSTELLWSSHRGELQDKLDRGEITPKEFFDARDLEMEERERLTPAFTTGFSIDRGDGFRCERSSLGATDEKH